LIYLDDYSFDTLNSRLLSNFSNYELNTRLYVELVTNYVYLPLRGLLHHEFCLCVLINLPYL
jgi:hypothetical protein